MLESATRVAIEQLHYDPRLNLYDSFLRVRDIVPQATALLGEGGAYSYEDMAEVLQLPEKTVKSRLFSARQRLKDALQQHGLVQP